MKRFQLRVGKEAVNFTQRDGEEFGDALDRGAKKIGYNGGAFTQPNFHINHQVTVCGTGDGNSRPAYNGVCYEL